MALTFVDVDGNLETAVASGGKQWLRPFEDVADDFIFRQKYFQLASKFAATPLDEAHPELQGFYLVAEDGIQPVQQSGVLEFFRTYSKIPDPRTVAVGYSYYRPAFSTTNPPGAALTISGAVVTNGAHVLTLAAVTDLAVNDLVLIQYNEFMPGIGTRTQPVRRTITAISGNDITVNIISTAGTIQSWLTAREVSPSRDATTISVPSEVEYDYFLPGVSPGIDTAADIGRVDAFEGLAADGGFTNTLTETTEPTVAQYLTKIGSGERIVVESSTLKRWRGNIFERAVRYAPAA